MGLCTTSASPPTPVGSPRRTGRSNTCSASSGTPCMIEVPPVTTTPAEATSCSPARVRSRATSVKISSTRGWMISERIWRDSWRGPVFSPRPPPSPFLPPAPPPRGHVDGLVPPAQRRERAAVALLQLLGVPGRRAQPHRDVVGDVVAAQREDPRVPDGAVPEERHVGGAAAQVDQQDPQLLLLGRDDSLRGSQRLEDDVPHPEPRPRH